MEATKNYILDTSLVEKKLRRMTYEIVENNMDEKSIILAGIRESGVILAKNLQKRIGEISKLKVELIDILLDKKKPGKVTLSKSMDFNDKVIIIMDDVVNSGKTLLYAMKPFMEYHPKKIETLVLVERSHKSYPIHADYVGLSIATTLQEHIYVEVKGENIQGAYLS